MVNCEQVVKAAEIGIREVRMDMARKVQKRKWLRRLLIVLAVLALLVIAVFCTMGIAYRHRSDPSGLKHFESGNPFVTAGDSMISAHRAGAGIAPEETLKAFANCIEDERLTIDLFEFDLHITKDDVLVLLHDPVLDRVSDCETVFGRDNCRPEDYTFEQLRQLNMGAKFVDAAGRQPYAALSGDAVPDELKILDLDMTLDYLEAAGNFRYIIEVKNEGELGKRSVDILYRTLKERNLLDRVIFGCFHEEVSRYKDAAYPDLARGAYGKEVYKFYFCCLLGIKAYEPTFAVLQFPFNDTNEDHHFNTGTVSIVNYAHAHGLAVQYWTINNEEDIAYLMSIGADAIMTDYPDKASKVRAERGGA